MTLYQGLITAGIVALATMATRFLPFLLFPEGKKPPAFVVRLGRTLPYAAMGLLVVYCLKDAVPGVYYGLPELISIVCIALLHIWKRSTLLSIGAGTVIYMLLVQLIF